jgi:aspartyl-tRNA(Asn)/glutamyl-tRNA(Gln) amidotransferase subunit B
MQELHEIVRAVGASDADMEKGQMRCDANISVQLKGERVKGKAGSSSIVEIKNLNSFRFVEKALAFEEKRLREEYDNWPGKQTKMTRGFDANKGVTFSMREKEEAKDYRYFPEPDVPSFDLTKFPIAKWREEIPKLPSHHRAWLSDLGLTKEEAGVIAKDDIIKDLVENVAEGHKAIVGKLLINNVEAKKLSIEALNDLANVASKKIPSNILRQVISASAASGDLPTKVYEKLSSGIVDLSTIIVEVLADNADAVEKFKAGKTEVIGFLIGQVMQKTQGKADPNEVREKLVKKIEGR